MTSNMVPYEQFRAADDAKDAALTRAAAAERRAEQAERERDEARAKLAEAERERNELLQHERDVAHACGVEHVWDYGCEPGPRDEVVRCISDMARDVGEHWEEMCVTRDHLALTRRRALLLGEDRRDWKRIAKKRAASNEQLRHGMCRYMDLGVKWRRACLSACKRADEWKRRCFDGLGMCPECAGASGDEDSDDYCDRCCGSGKSLVGHAIDMLKADLHMTRIDHVSALDRATIAESALAAALEQNERLREVLANIANAWDNAEDVPSIEWDRKAARLIRRARSVLAEQSNGVRND